MHITFLKDHSYYLLNEILVYVKIQNKINCFKMANNWNVFLWAVIGNTYAVSLT